MNLFNHTTVTATVTAFNPFLPTIGRVYQVLLDAVRIGETIETTNRELAEAAQCSASAIPDILRELESRRYIERITSGRGSLIVVAERSPMTDRSDSDQSCDQKTDRSSDRQSERSVMGDRLSRAETPDRSSDRQSERSDMSDPPLHPPIWNHVLAAEDSAAALKNVLPLGGSGGDAIGNTDRWPDRTDVADRLVELGCDEAGLIDEILHTKPALTLAQIESQWQLAIAAEEDGYTVNARRLLFGTLRKPGGWLYGRVTSGAVDWSAYAQAADEGPPRVIGETEPEDSLPPEESPHARARRITPDDISGRDFQFVLMRLGMGDSDQEALAALAARRRR